MKIITWNMQGASHGTENKWNEGVLHLFSETKADIFFLQECGGRPSSAKAAGKKNGLELYTWGTTRSLKYMIFYSVNPADPNNRCNLAIVSNVEPADVVICWPAAGPIWRPIIGIKINDVYYFSIHAISPGGADILGLLNAANTNAKWVVGGDYNKDPDDINIQNCPNGIIICKPNGNTQPTHYPERRLDYVIKNTGTAVIGSVIGLNMSDHLPVVFDIND